MHVKTSGKNNPGRGSSVYKGSELRTSLACSRKRKKSRCLEYSGRGDGREDIRLEKWSGVRSHCRLYPSD